MEIDLERNVVLSHKQVREIAMINDSVSQYFKSSYPEAFLFYCDFCKKNTPCSGENWGIECEHEKKFKI